MDKKEIKYESQEENLITPEFEREELYGEVKKIVVVDPTNEYENLVKILGNQEEIKIVHLSADNLKVGTFNPFELDSDGELKNISDRLDIIIGLIAAIYEKDLSNTQKELLSKYLNELYKQYNSDNVPNLLSFTNCLKGKNESELEDIIIVLEQYLKNTSDINFES